MALVFQFVAQVDNAFRRSPALSGLQAAPFQELQQLQHTLFFTDSKRARARSLGSAPFKLSTQTAKGNNVGLSVHALLVML